MLRGFQKLWFLGNNHKSDSAGAIRRANNVLRGGCEISETLATSQTSHAHPCKSAESKSSALWYAPCNIDWVDTTGGR